MACPGYNLAQPGQEGGCLEPASSSDQESSAPGRLEEVGKRADNPWPTVPEVDPGGFILWSSFNSHPHAGSAFVFLEICKTFYRFVTLDLSFATASTLFSPDFASRNCWGLVCGVFFV